MSEFLDAQHVNAGYALSEVKHNYGPGFHILSDHILTTYLARLSSQNTIQPQINQLVDRLYQQLILKVASAEFPKAVAKVETRMINVTKRGVWEGDVVEPSTPVVIASMARAGILPGLTCFNTLSDLLDGNVVRHDYFGIGRVVNNEHKVTGAAVTYSKVGGPFKNAILVIPDPMGATGGSVVETVRTYEREVNDRPRKTIAIHLIITPEYIRRIKQELPELEVYAVRLDRGMSDPDVLASVPGTYPDRERGLTDNHYIVPGAGGLGEIMTNAFV